MCRDGDGAMTSNQRLWSLSRNDLVKAVTTLGYPEEFADLLAKQLGSPKAIDRMTSYIYHAKPQSLEMIVDEMLAITAEIDAWREKKESQEAQAGYNAWLRSEARWNKAGTLYMIAGCRFFCFWKQIWIWATLLWFIRDYSATTVNISEKPVVSSISITDSLTL